MLDMIEQYFGCECYCLNHIAHMGYFPPEKDEKVDEEYDVIYLSVKTENHLRRIVPFFGLDPRDWLYDFKDYIRFNFLKRISIAISYVFEPLYIRKDGVFDCFDFQNKDLPSMKKFLSNLTDKEELVSSSHSLTLDNERWEIRFSIDRINEDFPYWLGWEVQFISRKKFGRIKYALKYIFGKVDDEQHFEINKKDAARLKGLITVTRKMNEKDERV